MIVTIPDQYLADATITDKEVLIEIACRLFAAQKIFKPHAAKLAGLSRTEFEAELIKRDLPLVLYDEEMLKRDLSAVKQMEERRVAGRK